MKRVVYSVVLAVLIAGVAWAQGPVSFDARTDNNAPIAGFLPVGTGGTCPNIVVNGTLGSGSPDWPSVSGTQTGRLNRNGISSTCAAPKACLIFDGTPGRAFDAYTFTNASPATACVTVTLDVITQTACNLQVNAYTGTYNPASICTNYLADPGLSSGVPPSQVSFSTNVLSGNDFVLSVHTTNPGEIGCLYTLTVAGEICSAEADLALTKTADAPNVALGDTVTYTLTVTNNGPGMATNVVVTDSLPTQLVYVSNNCSANFADPTVTWNVGSLANGASATCDILATVEETGTIVNMASATATETDPNPGDNTGIPVTIVGGNPLDIPTLSTAGIVAMLVALGLAAVVVLRRRS